MSSSEQPERNDGVNFSEDVARVNPKRLALVIGTVVALAGLMFLLAFFMLNQSGPESGEIDLTSDDKTAVEQESNKIVAEAGNFGIKDNVLTADNARKIRNTLNSSSLTDSNNDAGEYAVSRSELYDSIRGDIFPGSPADYSTRTVDEWDTKIEEDQLWSVRSDNIRSKTEGQGATVNVNDKNYKTANVKVYFDGKETKRMSTAQDTSWDGSYKVLEKKFDDSQMDLTFIQDDYGNWKLYEVKNLSEPFLTALWNIPRDGSSEEYQNSQFGFEQVDVLKPSKPIK